MRLLDANLIVRALTNDVPDMADAALALLQRIEAGEEGVEILEATVAEVVYVLGSRLNYARSRDWIVDRLVPVLSMPELRMEHKGRCTRALQLFVALPGISFADALIAAATLEQEPHEVYSFDRGLDRVPGLTRIEPVAS